MKERTSGLALVLVVAVLAVAALAGAFATSAAAADTPATPALAGLLTDGSLYVSADDGYWHPISPLQLVAAGYSLSAVTWYGQLPGTVAPAEPPTTATVVSIAPPALAGLIGTGAVYVAADGYWHHVTPLQFAAAGYGWAAVTWYGELPGTIAVGG